MVKTQGADHLFQLLPTEGETEFGVWFRGTELMELKLKTHGAQLFSPTTV